MNPVTKTVVLWSVMLVGVILLWQTLRHTQGQLRETVGALLLGLLLFWAIGMTVTVLRHEGRIAKIEREVRSNAPPQG